MQYFLRNLWRKKSSHTYTHTQRHCYRKDENYIPTYTSYTPCKPQFYHIKVGFKRGQNYIGVFSWCQRHKFAWHNPHKESMCVVYLSWSFTDQLRSCQACHLTYSHFSLDRLTKWLTSPCAHTLPITDSWIGRKWRMTTETITWSLSMKVKQQNRNTSLQPLGQMSDMLMTGLWCPAMIIWHLSKVFNPCHAE